MHFLELAPPRVWLALAGILCIWAGLRLRGWRKRHLRGLPLERRWGTVYVLRDQTYPDYLKIGTTRRATRVRAAEVSRDMAHGRPLAVVYAIDMPCARAAEALAHRRLARRNRRTKRHLGREWFKVRGDSGVREAIEVVEASARDVRRLARRRRKWPCSGDARSSVWSRPADSGRAERRHPFIGS